MKMFFRIITVLLQLTICDVIKDFCQSFVVCSLLPAPSLDKWLAPDSNMIWIRDKLELLITKPMVGENKHIWRLCFWNTFWNIRLMKEKLAEYRYQVNVLSLFACHDRCVYLFCSSTAIYKCCCIRQRVVLLYMAKGQWVCWWRNSDECVHTPCVLLHGHAWSRTAPDFCMCNGHISQALQLDCLQAIAFTLFDWHKQKIGWLLVECAPYDCRKAVVYRYTAVVRSHFVFFPIATVCHSSAEPHRLGSGFFEIQLLACVDNGTLSCHSREPVQSAFGMVWFWIILCFDAMNKCLSIWIVPFWWITSGFFWPDHLNSLKDDCRKTCCRRKVFGKLSDGHHSCPLLVAICHNSIINRTPSSKAIPKPKLNQNFVVNKGVMCDAYLLSFLFA